MSTFNVLQEVSRTLRNTVWDAIRPGSGGIPLPLQGTKEQAIVFTSPSVDGLNNDRRLSIWLYKIDEDQYTRNQPRTPLPDKPGLRGVPMTLDLNFLMTPLYPDKDAEANLLMLGRIMQVFHQTPSIPVADAAAGIHENLRVSFKRLSLEELTRVWESVRQPYRLSVCYLVRVVHIQGAELPGAGQVKARETGVLS